MAKLIVAFRNSAKAPKNYVFGVAGLIYITLIIEIVIHHHNYKLMFGLRVCMFNGASKHMMNFCSGVIGIFH